MTRLDQRMITDYQSKLNSPVPLAIAVLVERVRRIPKEGRENLYELSRAWFLAKTPEEEESATLAMQAIMEQSSDVVHGVETFSRPGQDLNDWVGWVSERIRTLRLEAGMTQRELEDKSGLPQSHISRLENGEHSPSIVTLEKIAKAVGGPVSKFDPPTKHVP